MSKWVDNYRRAAAARVMLITLLAAGAAAGAWRVIDWLAAAPGIALALSGASVILIAYLASLAGGRLLVMPLKQIDSALNHVQAGPSQQPAPDISQGAGEAVQQIYELAAGARKLTANIDGQRLFLTAAIDLLPIGVLIFDHEQNLKFINQNGAKLLNHPPKDLQALPISKVLDWLFQTDEDYGVWLERARSHKIKDQHFWERVSVVRTDGERVIGDVAASYEKNQSDGIETVVVFMDRTAQYVADQSQLDFVAVAAHELRGPITVIRGYLDVFNEEMSKVFNVEQRALLQKMTVSAEMLSLYVNNILNVARLDQQALKLHVIKADWRDIVKEAYAELFLRAQARGRVLKLDMPATISPVGVDRVSVLEVINNLVDNAIKYSDEGGEIIIKVREHDGLVETTVQDFGIGIPQAVVGNLFKKFYRSHKTRRGVSGTGLGLYLSKAITDAHGGNIWVRSTEGQGSTFGFDLPTYDTIADTLKAGDGQGEDIKRSSRGWIKNHAMYRR